MTSWSILRFPATDFAAMTKAHLHELFMKGCCVYSSSVKRMFTVNHEQHWTKKWICFKFAQRKYDSNLCKLGDKSEQRW